MKRAAVVGTAQTWKMTPWDDASLYIVGLNDAYSLGFPRADEWWELHPLDKMVFRPKHQKIVKATDIPPGHYVRPEGHIEWLKEQARTIPVYLQKEPPDDWPGNARRFQLEAIEAKYGTYWASGPAYELLDLYERGYREIHVYGIHLATEAEYREQRPNFEMILGRMLGAEVREERRGDLRYYHGKDCTIVLPVATPLLQHGWKYAYEPRPVPAPNPYAAELKAARAEKQDVLKRLIRPMPARERERLNARLRELEVIEIDVNQQLSKRAMGGTVAIALVG